MKKSLAFYLILIGVVLAVMIYIQIFRATQSEVDDLCKIAAQKYPGDKVEALIKYLNDEQETLNPTDFNRFCWALGELRDKRALPTLEKLMLKPNIDKYEIKKAIKKITGKIPNPYFWRKFF